MVRAGKIPFFLTETGRRLVFYGSTTLTIGLFAGHYLPHTIGIGYYKELFQAYKNGEQRQVSDKLQQRFNRAVQLLNLSNIERKYVSPFMVYGFDVSNAGSMKARFGGVVGIPINFQYDNSTDIEKSDMLIGNRKVDWASEGGKLLDECLILSEDEQVFGIAREILTLNTNKRLIQAIIPTVSWFFTYSAASSINQRCNFYVRPLSLRLMLYAICSLFGYGLYSFSQDMTEIYYDTDVDKQLAALGPEVVDAGARFYDKVLKKNVAVRKLTGDDYYTAKGNVNYLIRQKATPLTIRKEFFVTDYKDFIPVQEKS
ncbi:transmembrane protein 177-like [Armigeres subalbatus]|uniref:transmembrane protein 177-like n=1 Tax=Armigeres subalbatus TaxID=124917 RepID=UPI002ED55709